VIRATCCVLSTIVTITIAHAETISGRAYVLDGDTVIVNSTHVRLKGVDAAELRTPLGDAAKQMMIKIVGRSDLTCELTGERSYNREVGFCRTSSGVDIGQAIVASGAALACPHYSTRYVRFERPEALAAQIRATYCVVR
jgi:micrococcal nuclease